MISEDHVTHGWSNDAKNSALITAIIYFLKIYSHRKMWLWNVIIFQNISFYCISDQIHVVLVHKRDFFQRNIFFFISLRTFFSDSKIISCQINILWLYFLFMWKADSQLIIIVPFRYYLVEITKLLFSHIAVFLSKILNHWRREGILHADKKVMRQTNVHFSCGISISITNG